MGRDEGIGEPTYFLRLLYGDWLGGLRETFFSPAFDRTASSVRPSLRPITLVGVFPAASLRSSRTSPGFQSSP